jgi:hypothetical protein
VVVAEGNEFHKDRYDFGFLPPGVFNQILNAFLALHPAGKTLTPRA